MAELGINLPVLLTQVVTIIILLVLLRLVAYKPIMRMLDERSRRIKESMEQAEAIKEQSARAGEEVRKQLEAASREGQERIARAVRCRGRGQAEGAGRSQAGSRSPYQQGACRDTAGARRGY